MIKLKKRKFIKVFSVTLLALVICVSFPIVSFGAVSDYDASIILSQQKPASVHGWLRPTRSSSIYDYLYQSQGSFTYPSTAWFRSVQNFDYAYSFSTSADTLVFYKYTNNIQWETDLVYSIVFDIQFSPAYSDYIPVSDWSKLLLVFPVDYAPSANFSPSEYSYYFYNGFAPSSYAVGSSGTFIRFTYNIPIYPSSTFSRSEIYNGHITTNGFGLLDSGTGMVHATQSLDGTYFRYSETFIFRSAPVVNVYTPDQFSSVAISGAIGGLSQQIDNSTTQIIDSIDSGFDEVNDNLNEIISGDNLPDMDTPLNDVVAEVQSSFEDYKDLHDFWFSASRQTDVSNILTATRTAIEPYHRALTAFTNWFNYTYENVSVLYVLVGFVISMLFCYALMRLLF